MKVGKFLVVNAYDVRATHLGIDLEGMDEHRENGIQQGNAAKSEQEHEMNLERTTAENTVSQHPIIGILAWEEGPGQLLSQLEAMPGNILNIWTFPFLQHPFHHQDHASYDSNSLHLRCQCPLPHAHLA